MSLPPSLSLRRRGVYLLPNAFTTMSLLAGFYSVVQTLDAQYAVACMAIFVAMILDGLDGRVARMTHTQTDFGAEYDSLSDMVSFGVAPAILIYQWALRPLEEWGLLAAFAYCVGAALRLARFNANLGVIDKRYFQGLPSPAAAALIAGFVWLVIKQDLPVKDPTIIFLSWILPLYAGITMISNVPFYSFKDLGRYRRVPVIVFFGFGMIVFLAKIYPWLAIFSLFIIYGISGYILWLWHWSTGRRSSEILRKTSPVDDEPVT